MYISKNPKKERFEHLNIGVKHLVLVVQSLSNLNFIIWRSSNLTFKTMFFKNQLVNSSKQKEVCLNDEDIQKKRKKKEKQKITCLSLASWSSICLLTLRASRTSTSCSVLETHPISLIYRVEPVQPTKVISPTRHTDWLGLGERSLCRSQADKGGDRWGRSWSPTWLRCAPLTVLEWRIIEQQINTLVDGKSLNREREEGQSV